LQGPREQSGKFPESILAVVPLAARGVRPDTQNSPRSSPVSECRPEDALLPGVKTPGSPDIEEKFNTRRDLVDVLSARTTAPCKHERNFILRYAEPVSDFDVFRHVELLGCSTYFADTPGIERAMSDRSINGYTVRIAQSVTLGSAWVVRVYRNRFPFKKNVSSDWFLDGAQANLYADQVAAELRDGRGYENLRERKPGWTLRRPAR
jgi:hypothetical protein